MDNTNCNFFRNPNSDEHLLIKEEEDIRYGKEIKSIRILLIIEGIAAIAAILGFFLPIGIGLSRRIILLVIDAFLVGVTIPSLIITNRQFKKINELSYKVQNVTVTDVHNEVHGLISDMIVTFTSDDESTYTMNTNTTGDMIFAKGIKGLLVIIDGEKNVLLTSKYRFHVTHLEESHDTPEVQQ